MDRRTLIKTGGMAVLGLGFGGCAARTASPRRPMLNLPPVRASWDRVIRTTVGLRPHRPTGFLVRPDRLDAKLLIHNYGHGGAGMSLSWGTGQMAAEMALEHAERRAAVIGCGAAGLTTARQLQRRGFSVTIYAKTVPPETTSNMSLAAFTPTSGLVSGPTTPEWEAQFRRAATIGYRQLQLFAGRHYGVDWLDSYSLRQEPPREPREGGGDSLLPAELRTGQVLLEPGEHPFPAPYVTVRSSLRIEPSIYLDALVRDVLAFGGRIVIRTFDRPQDLMSLTEPIIVNCSGLGAREVAGDETVMPVKGQLTHLIPQPEINYRCSGGGSPAEGRRGVGMNPRSDGLALSGTFERGEWSLEPNEESRQQIVEAAIQLFGAMRRPAPGARLARSTPPAVPPSLESFFGEES